MSRLALLILPLLIVGCAYDTGSSYAQPLPAEYGRGEYKRNITVQNSYGKEVRRKAISTVFETESDENNIRAKIFCERNIEECYWRASKVCHAYPIPNSDGHIHKNYDPISFRQIGTSSGFTGIQSVTPFAKYELNIQCSQNAYP